MCKTVKRSVKTDIQNLHLNWVMSFEEKILQKLFTQNDLLKMREEITPASTHNCKGLQCRPNESSFKECCVPLRAGAHINRFLPLANKIRKASSYFPA
jgi:hypothetical protein